MLIIYHQNNKVIEVEYEKEKIRFSDQNIAKTLFEIASLYPDNLIVWCQIDFKNNLNISKFQNIFHHKKIMASYNPFNNSYISDAIGYVEESPFIKINKNVNYPTWQMSSYIGGVHASVLAALNGSVKITADFDYFLNSLAKLTMPEGLLSYSEPSLLAEVSYKNEAPRKNVFVLFRFVKQHYRARWILLLFVNLFFYERRIAVLPLIYSFFYSQVKLKKNLFDKIEVHSTKKVLQSGTIDVIIPTIGRKQYLHDVLKDLSLQTHLPKNVIIVEQNPNMESISELDFVENTNWPFKIKHTFTHQAGACNARNLALAQVESEFVFLNDDDNRMGADLIEKTIQNCKKFGSNVASNSYLKINEKKESDIVNQAPIFGSGNSFIISKLLDKVSFRMGFEFGYGEDADFGMQLRNAGEDVLYFPNPVITHLSAPIGGFRTKPVLAWQNDIVQPKPSPTVMLYKILHLTKEQINGYKTVLFFKFYKLQAIKNPIRYFYHFKKQWHQSEYWANQLKNK